MEAIGEMLRSAREAKKLTLKEISKDTNISSKYLAALEEEEFDKLPGETYVIGFLKNYAEYLKIDSDEIINSYKGYKIGESATPLEELTKPTSPIAFTNLLNLFNKYKFIFYITGLCLFIILSVWIFNAIFSSEIVVEESTPMADIKNEYNSTDNGSELKNIRNIKLKDDREYILVDKNEAIQFLVDNKEAMFLLKDIMNNSVTLEVLPSGLSRTIEMEKPAVFDIEDFDREIILTLKGSTKNRAKLFVMLGKKKESAVKEEAPEEEIKKDVASETVVAHNRKNLKIVFEAEFTRKTYLELYLDGIKKKKGIIPAGVKKRWEATENIQFKIGNAGGLKATINGKNYIFGLPGQVANKVVTWKKDVNNPNLYHIVIKDW